MHTINGCSIVQKIVIEIVIEIGMELTRLFQRNRFHYADFRDWNRDWIFQNEQWKILTEIGVLLGSWTRIYQK